MSWAAGLAIACLAATSALAQDPAPGQAPGAEPGAVEEALAEVPSAGSPATAGADGGREELAQPAPAAVPADPTPSSSPDPVYERLLGDGEPPPVASEPAPPAVAPFTVAPPWLWGVLIVTAAGLLWLRGRIVSPPASDLRMRVVGRTLLGREGNLAVVEVVDGDRTRRMLIGYGGGAPRLVAELADSPGDAAPSATGGFAAALRRSLRPGEAAEAPSAPAPATREGGPRSLRPRSDLIAEVLAERSTVVGGDPVASGPEDDEDDPSAETYTFRGLLG